MAPISISWQDRDYITRAVATEADHRLARTNPDAYRSQVAGIVDTVLNRVASPQYPDSVEDVLNQYGQFSAINGPPRDYEVHGSVQNIPDRRVPAGLSDIVNEWINARIDGTPSSVGGALNYANIARSEGQKWLADLDGPQYGVPGRLHSHGTAEGGTPIEAVVQGQMYNGEGIPLPPEYVPEVLTLVDLNDPSSRIAKRVNAMWDAAPPVPEARSQGTLARTNAMLNQPRPAAMPESVRNIRTVNDTPPTPRPAAEGATARARAAEPAPPVERRLLPTIGPTGTTKQDPVGTMPAASELAALRSPRPVKRQNMQPAADIGAGRVTNPVTPRLTEDGQILTYHLPDQTPTTVQRGLGSLTPNAVETTAPNNPPRGTPGQSGFAAQDAAPSKPVPAPISAPRPVTRQAISYAAKEGTGAPRPDTSIRRVASPDPSTQAGNVAMPKDARPAIADALIRQAETAATRQQLSSNGQSFAGQERTEPPRPAAPPSRPMSYAGQERAEPHVASDATKLSWPPASPNRAQLTMANQSYAGQEGAPGLGGRKPSAAQAASPADVPKYVTTTTRVPVEAKPAPGSGQVPLGDVLHHRSRDSVAQEVAGKRDAEAGTWRTVVETKLNPEWVKQQQATQQATAPGIGTRKVTPAQPAQPAQPKPAEELDLGQRIRTSIGLPANGLAGVLGDNIRSAIGLGNSARRQPAAPVGTVLGQAANGGMMVQGRGGVMNTTTQNSEYWRQATGNQPRYTDNGNGVRTSESGGVYYDRHLR